MVLGDVSTFVTALVSTLGRRIRQRFEPPEQSTALQRVLAVAFKAAVASWTVHAQDAEHYADLFDAWLRDPEVLQEFHTLFTPESHREINCEILRAKLIARGFNAEALGIVSFDVFLQDMIGSFYQAAAAEPVLQEPMKIDLLRQIAQRTGALDRLAQRQAMVEEQTVGHLDKIRSYTENIARGQGDTNALLQKLVQAGKFVIQHGSALERIEAYQYSNQALTTVDPALPAVQPMLAILRDIHTQLTVANGGSSPETLAALEVRYRQTLIDQFANLTFEGLQPSGVPIVLPLAQIYVELKAVADVPEAADTYSAEERRLLLEAEGQSVQRREELAMHLDALRVERHNRQARQQIERLERRSIQELLDSPSHRGVVILGDPGSGKTTLLHYQALRTAQRQASIAPALLPIFVPLAAYDAHLHQQATQSSLGDFLALYYDRWHSLPGLAPLFRRVLDEGRAVVLLDGLDEVLNTTTRQFVAEQVGALIRQWTPQGNRFAVTSRIVGYREAPLPGALPYVTVLDFGQTEITLFATQWCRAYEVWVAGGETSTALQRAAAEERALREDVQGNPSVERLAASPLLLTMLALLRRQVGKLPDRRIDLYQHYVRTLIDNWQQYRSRGARSQMLDRFDFFTVSHYLMELALWLQQHKPSGTARRQELESVLERIGLQFEGCDPETASAKEQVQARLTAERFLREMRHFAGLLVERGRDAFGFLHLTFQEYFAARALARMAPDTGWDAIKPHLHHPRWREPILLCAGQLGIVEGRRDQANALAGRILKAQSAHEDILCRDLFLTAALAADDVGLTPVLFHDLAIRLIALQDSPVPIIRDTALGGLAQLARLGHGVALEVLLESLKKTHLKLHVTRAVKGVLSAQTCVPIRQAVLERLTDGRYDVRQAAVQALAGLVDSDTAVRQAVLERLTDGQDGVRQAAVQALAGLVDSDTAVRQAVLERLTDEWYGVRQAAVQALAGLVGSDTAVTQHLLPWLGTVGERFFFEEDALETQHLLAMTYAPLLVQQPALLTQVAQMLTSPAWPTRQGAARVLIAMPGGLPPHIHPALHSLLYDLRSEETWRDRLQVCEILLNTRDRDLSRRAIQVTIEALDYATQPWYGLPYTGAHVRREAARILAQLEPLHRDEHILVRLVRVLHDDADANVRDAAYEALLRLAAAPEELFQDTV